MSEEGPEGTHLIIDFSGCQGISLGDEILMEKLVRRAASRSGAAILQIETVRFPARSPASVGGLTAVAILAESHITIHTYPEARSAFIDIFTCGPHCTPRE